VYHHFTSTLALKRDVLFYTSVPSCEKYSGPDKGLSSHNTCPSLLLVETRFYFLTLSMDQNDNPSSSQFLVLSPMMNMDLEMGTFLFPVHHFYWHGLGSASSSRLVALSITFLAT
jgi:hypothetical protein